MFVTLAAESSVTAYIFEVPAGETLRGIPKMIPIRHRVTGINKFILDVELYYFKCLCFEAKAFKI